MTLQDRMQACQSSLTETDWQIYNTVMASDVRRLTMATLASSVHVSTTTIFRFCQKLGLSGFGELKALLKNQEKTARVSRKAVQSSYHDIVTYVQTLDISVLRQKLLTTDYIYLFAESELELRLAKVFQRIFFPFKKPVFILPNRQALENSLVHMANNVLVVFALSKAEQLPLCLRNHQRMSSIYTLVLSEVRQVSSLADVRLLIPSIVPDEAYPPVMTPYVLALEMLYLKLQLENK